MISLELFLTMIRGGLEPVHESSPRRPAEVCSPSSYFRTGSADSRLEIGSRLDEQQLRMYSSFRRLKEEVP